MSVTRPTIRQEVAKRTRLGVLLTGTAAGADSTHFQDNSIRAIGADTTILRANAPFIISSTVTDGPVIGETSRLTSTAITSAGIITLAPALTAAPKNTQTAEVWHPILDHSDHVNSAVNRALTERCTYWGLTPLSLLADGDMEGSGVTDWTGTNATPTKVAMAFPNTWGRQHLRVTNSAAGGYAYQTVACSAGDRFRLTVVARAGTGTISVTVYDVTNSAVITLEGEDDAVLTLGGWTVLCYYFDIPSGCRSISVRLGGVLITAVIDYAAACLWREDSRFLPLPTRIRHEQQIGQDVSYMVDTGNADEDATDPHLEPVGSVANVVQTQVGLGLRFQTAIGGNGPIFIQEQRPYSVLTSDTATTDCPDEYIYAAAAYETVSVAWLAEERRGVLVQPGPYRNPFTNIRAQLWREYLYRHNLIGATRRPLKRGQQTVRVG